MKNIIFFNRKKEFIILDIESEWSLKYVLRKMIKESILNDKLRYCRTLSRYSLKWEKSTRKIIF